jgi:biopolymer transport protein ExbB
VIVRNIRNALIGAAFAAQFAVPAAAQQFAAANSLDELLTEVERVRSDEDQQFQQRVTEFNSDQARQQQLLQEAQQRRQTLDATSQRLSDQYSANELRINDLNRQLREKADQLGLSQVFGLARQTANDAATVLQQSLISTQFPAAEGELPRDEFLRQFAASRRTPLAADLERLWLEIQREMTASGQVAKYRAAVVQLGGTPMEAEVVRIGPFTATSNGQFLAYLPSLRTLNVLPRQLPDEFMVIAERFESATSGYVQAVVDAYRGVTTGLYVERPTFGERIELGEEIGYVIILVGVLGVIAFLWQLVYLIMVRLSVNRQLKDLDQPMTNNPLGRVLLAFKGDRTRIEEDADVAELRITEAVLREVPKLERFQAFLRLAVAAGPLLGLIGTVVGMIITFQSITESGSSDPKLMATGIGQAMIATVLGLGIAIPLLFAGALLNSLSRGIVQILDEQSAGMLAESIEKQRRA